MGWAWSKWVWPHWSKDTKIGCISKEMNGINWFLVFWQKFRKAKSYFNNFWMVAIKNGHGLLGLGTLKSAVSQEWIDELVCFLLADTNLWKLKVTLTIIGWIWSKIGEALKIVGLSNQVYLTNDLMNRADWLDDFCILIVMEQYFALLRVFNIKMLGDHCSCT